MTLSRGPLRRARLLTAAVVLTVSMAACSPGAPTVAPATTPSPAAPTPAEPSPTPTALAGTVVRDSFGNADFYMPLAGDTLKDIAAQFKLSLSRLALFNGLSTMDYPTPGRTLRLIPAPGPITGAKGEATYDARGVPVSYVIAEQDTTGGLEYRFGLTQAQLAEANHVAHVYEQGNVYFMQPGRHIALQLGQ